MKKFLTLALALALAVTSMSVVAFADNDSEKEGEATIEFTADDPWIPGPDPDDEDWKMYDVRGLDFGIHELEDVYYVEQNFDSTKWAGRTEEDGTKVDPTASETTGFIIKNGKKDGWKVIVDIEDFMIGTEKTMAGFVMTLNIESTNATTTIGLPAHKTSAPISVGAANQIVTAQEEDGIGSFGYEYSGNLNIKAKTMDEGKPEAVMTWAVTAGPV